MDRIIVTPKELETAFTVWLKVMPANLWRPYLKMLVIDRTRRTDADRVDPREVLAAYLVDRFAQAKWAASYPKPTPYRDLTSQRVTKE